MGIFVVWVGLGVDRSERVDCPEAQIPMAVWS